MTESDVEEHTESWQLRSGTWHRDLKSDAWRLERSANGTAASSKLSSHDLGRMAGARRDTVSGMWFPPDFNYSPQTGTLLHARSTEPDSPWVPPFGASAPSDLTKPIGKGLRQTAMPLALARSNRSSDKAREADRTLPALPPGRYWFVVHQFDAVLPTLMAMELERGELLVLLPESNTWVPLEPPPGSELAEGLKNWRGWRMEVLEGAGCASLYLPTARGLAAVTPSVIGLSFGLQYFGEAIALGGPVGWAGEIWLPVLGNKGVVELIGTPRGGGKPTVLPWTARIPRHGFEAPVFDLLNVIWPSEQGQLVMRLKQRGRLETEWIAWPEGRTPVFSSGSPYLSRSGAFWQLCHRSENRSFEYVRMGKADPETVAVDAPRLGTGHASYKQDQRIDGDPWSEPEGATEGGSPEVVVPLLESEVEHAVVGLRMAAPQGVLALFESNEPQHAVLQLQAQNGPAIEFGTMKVARPWLTSLFIYDAHLWAYHPELPQALGWKLEHPEGFR